MQIIRANKYRLYPSAKQKQILSDYFGASRFVFNNMLGKLQNNHFGEHKTRKNKVVSRIPDQTEFSRELTNIKDEHPFLRQRANDLMQSSIADLYNSCKNFYKGSGYPKFKSRKNKNQSFEMKAGLRIKLRDNYIFLPKPREGNYSKEDLTIKFKKHKSNYDLPEKLIKYTISKDNLNQYWISFAFKVELLDQPKSLKNSVGIDLGIKDLVIKSDGNSVGNDKLTANSAKRLKFYQKSYARKQKFSKNQKKSRYKIAKIHHKIANQRNFRNHQISRQLVNENNFVSMESLKIKNMMKNKRLAKSIADASWSDLVEKIKYKMTEKQGHFYQINQWFPSTKMCSGCGNIKEIMGLDERTYFCEECNLELDRDINAAINIKNQGLHEYKLELGMNSPELVKIKPFA